ncbi:MAG: peptide ABC transporter [Chloroflexi bacterium RBG_13_52_12]|nr:MAG: peptide ABC transporter [Chloroflexi bacterium RBG_13_52_12]
MTVYIIRRVLLAVFCLFMITLIVFFAMRLLPGDPIIIYIGQSQQLSTLSEEGMQKLREEFGLDKPLMVQYLNWVSGLVRFDFGNSIFYHMPVGTLLRERYPVTINLGIYAFVISTVLGIMAGVLAAVRRGRWADKIVTPLSYVGITMPVFWLGILMIYVLGLRLNWLPIIGYTSPFEDLWMSIKQAIMPVICLSIGALAGIARQARSSMLEVIRQDYIRTAWSKGLAERIVILKHALKNSLIPVVTVLGLQLGFIFGGSVIVETVFSIPGIGYLMVTSIFSQDYSVVQSCTLVFAVVVVFANLIVDIAYAWLDPRIQYG